ncbi:MAG: hypothetical protein JXR58_05660 [Bacteroidales bacterium]|nr:hypothetical protein [Bacteroidales bacterium]
MKQITALLLLLTVFQINIALGQEESKPSLFIPSFSADYSFQIPGGDLKDRFGNNSMIGSSFQIKLKSNFTLGVKAGFIFGANVKEPNMFRYILPSEGQFINTYGNQALVMISERGFHFSTEVGKIFPFSNKNPDSGLWLKGSLGLLQHKIRIDNDGNNVPYIIEEYSKGYDRLTNGLAVTEFVGYIFYGESMIANFYAGFEFYQAFTQCRRDYNFDDLGSDLKKRKDYLYSFKLGWIIPLYKRINPDKYFYY